MTIALTNALFYSAPISHKNKSKYHTQLPVTSNINYSQTRKNHSHRFLHYTLESPATWLYLVPQCTLLQSSKWHKLPHLYFLIGKEQRNGSVEGAGYINKQSGRLADRKMKGQNWKTVTGIRVVEAGWTEVVGGNTVLFYYANRNVRDHDVNYPIFFATVSAARCDGLLITFAAVIRFWRKPRKNVDAHSIGALAICQALTSHRFEFLAFIIAFPGKRTTSGF